MNDFYQGKYLKQEILKYVQCIAPKDPLNSDLSSSQSKSKAYIEDIPYTLQHGLRFIADQVSWGLFVLCI